VNRITTGWVAIHTLAVLTEHFTRSSAYANLADRIHTLHSLADKHINLSQLLNYLLGLVSLVRHSLSSVS
jgi:hypothetical protein